MNESVVGKKGQAKCAFRQKSKIIAFADVLRGFLEILSSLALILA